MEKKRLQYIDIAKGICILLVVIGHILQYNFEGSAKDSTFSFIYSFHMPVFMLLSGYVAALSHRRIDRIEASNFIKKKFLSLVVPFCTWGLLLTPFVIDQHPFAELLPTAKNLFLYPSTGAWFIIVLFCFQLYFLLFRSMTERFFKTISLKSDGISFMVVFGLLSFASQGIKHCDETIVGGGR